MGDVRGLQLAADEREWLLHPLIGGVILFARNYADREQLAALMQSMRELRPDILVAVDTEGGRVQRFRSGFTRLPPLAAYGALYATDPAEARELAELGGQILGGELAAFDIDLPFAPVLDLDGGVSAIIGDRALHADPAATSELARAHMRGLHAGGVATTGKHFPGHGAVVPDSHEELPVDERPESALQQADLLPYRDGLSELDSVMAAHVVYPQVDPRAASFSPYWLQTVLREQLGFAGVVFADDLNMGGAREQGDIVARAEQAFAAGCDMLPVCNNPEDLATLLSQWQCPDLTRGEARLRRLRRRGAAPTIPVASYERLHAAGMIASATPPPAALSA